APVRWHLWTVFAAAALAAIGVTWWSRGASWTRRAAAFCIAAFAVGVVGSVAAPDAEPTLHVLLRAITVFSGLALLAVALTLTKPAAGSRWLTGWTVAVLSVVAADLVWANWGLNPTTTADFYDPQAPATTARAFWPKDSLDTVMFDQHLLLDDYRMTPGQIAAYRASGLPNLNLLDGGDLLNNFDPLLVGGYAAFVERLNDSANPGALYRAAGISAVYDENGELRPLGDAPLAWLAGAECWGTGAQIAARLAFPDSGWLFDPKVYLTGEGPCLPAAGASGAVAAVSPDLTRIDVQVDAEDGAWLVVARTWYPGWQAAVDGLATPMERANLAFSAVRVAEGQHTVTFAYAPGWLPWAAALSLAGLIGLLVIFALARREAPYNASE
ncbi:MAG: YfhO family protein, partial [Caldilineaceae bacterium]